MMRSEAKTRINHHMMVLAALVAALLLLLIAARGASGEPNAGTPPLAEGPGTGEPSESPGYAGLVQKAEREGHVRVIVGLRTDFTPEGRLSRPEVADQRRDIASARAELRADLQHTDYRSLRQFETIPYVALEVSPEALRAAQNSPNVSMIHEDLLLTPTLDDSGPIVQAPQMWAAGYTGSGQTIAVLDSGVDSSHPFLSGKVVEEACFSAGSDCPNGSTSQTGTGSGMPCTYAEGCAHGTHVAGIAAGIGSSFFGVAKGANIMSVQITSKVTGAGCDDATEDPCNLSDGSDMIAGLERVYELRSSHDFSSVNLSFGGDQYFGDCDTAFPEIKAAIDNLKSVGIATVISSGNEGYTDSLNTPACVSSAVSVGATDDTDHVASSSNWGSNSASILDLLAPGDNINSSVPGGGFESWSGTSMAAPHVAGAWALLKQQDPSASVDEILSALKSTGTPVTDDRVTNGVTKPRINIADASTFLNPLANDDFANARGLISSEKVSVKGNNVGATRQSGEPDHLPDSLFTGEHSLWYEWTAPTTGRASLNTCLSSFDTALAVYTGSSVSSLSRKASDDDSCPSSQFFNDSGSVVTFDVTKGTSYKIAVSGRSLSQQGTFTLKSFYVPPANDDFADAQMIGGGTHFSKNGSNVLATREPGEPDHLLNSQLLGESSVWYDWTAPETGEVTIGTCLSNFDTLLNVYTDDSLNALSPTASDDDSCPDVAFSNDYASKATFDVTEGTSYKIAISSLFDDSFYQGSFILKVDYTLPVNDAFSGAQEISGSDASANGTNIGATRQSGEPDHLPGSPVSSGEESVWYRWTAPASGPVTLDTCVSDFGANLAVYTGSLVNALSPTSTDHSVCEGSSDGEKLTLDATAGTTYGIAVFSGFSSGRGNFTLKLAQDGTPPSVKSVKPAAGATGVGPAANVRAVFSEAMQASTVNATTFTLRKKGTNKKVLATISYDPATNKALLNPDANLKRGATYIARVSPKATDEAGNRLDQKPATSGNQAKVWKFKVKP